MMNKQTRPLFKRKLGLALAVSLLLTGPVLSGCVAVVGATAVTAAASASDRRTLGTQVEDRTISLKANQKLRETFGSGAHLNATVYNRRILLTGEVPDETSRNRAEGAVANITNLREIVNDIQVAGVASATSISNDALLTAKVKASLIDSQDVSAAAFKVTTEAGVVYLMGLVTEREGQRAAEIASGVSGVKKVVKVLDLISETELANMSKTGAQEGDAGGSSMARPR